MFICTSVEFSLVRLSSIRLFFGVAIADIAPFWRWHTICGMQQRFVSTFRNSIQKTKYKYS